MNTMINSEQLYNLLSNFISFSFGENL